MTVFPMLGNLPILYPKKIIVRGWLSRKRTLTHHQDKIAFPDHPVDDVIFHYDPLLCHDFQRCTQSRKTVINVRVMLNILITIEIGGELFGMQPDQDILHKILDQVFVFTGFMLIRYLRLPIKHGMTTRIAWSNFLQIVPMFNDLPVFELEDIKPGFWPEEIIFRVGSNQVTIFDHPNGIHFC